MKINLPSWLKAMLLGLAISAVVSLLLYDSPIPMLLSPIFIIICYRVEKAKEKEAWKQQLEQDFVTAMSSVSSGLLAGLSMENAWREAYFEFQSVAKGRTKPGRMERQMAEIIKSMDLNIPLEKLVLDFGYESQSEEIIGFAEVFSYAKRSGGDMVMIINRTVEQMRQKQEVGQEIKVLVASKQMEQKIMNILPIFMLGYLRLTSADYIGALYHKPLGVGIMTGCLLLYGGALWWSKKILNIAV